MADRTLYEWRRYVAEAIGTFALVAIGPGAVWCRPRHRRANATAVAPFAIGATVFAGALVTGPLTGGSFNPARSLGPAVVGGIWTSHWLYWLAPTIGMVAAMHAYEAPRGVRATPASDRYPLGVEGPVDVSSPPPDSRSA